MISMQIVEPEPLHLRTPWITKVVVAEDQPAMRALVARHLRAVGYEVEEVEDGEALWRTFNAPRDGSDEPDLIVSDVHMPKGNGLVVLDAIRQSHWALPVILMTAFGDEATHAEARRLGAAIFDKPFDVSKLVAQARKLVEPR